MQHREPSPRGYGAREDGRGPAHVAEVILCVINNFNDDGARKMLANCRDAMSAAARLLIVDALYPIGKPVLWGLLAGLGVLAQRGGRGRTEPQMRTLLESTPFRICSVKVAGKGAPGLEAAPA
jgi:hypothetical protein